MSDLGFKVDKATVHAIYAALIAELEKKDTPDDTLWLRHVCPMINLFQYGAVCAYLSSVQLSRLQLEVGKLERKYGALDSYLLPK